jgi:methylase of polypeptide subunit release factors
VVVLHAVFGSLSRSRWVARLLFRFDLPSLPPGGHYFDVTTLALLKASRLIPAGASVLDLGTGSAALIALSLWRRGCRVEAVEIDAGVADEAERCIRRQGAHLPLRRANLLEGAPSDTEFLLFNPPYVPTAVAERRGLPDAYRSQWDGGPDGTRVIAAFLDALEAHDGCPTAFLGINGRHVPRARVEALVAERPGLRLEDVVSERLLGVQVFVLSSGRSDPVSPAATAAGAAEGSE